MIDTQTTIVQKILIFKTNKEFKNFKISFFIAIYFTDFYHHNIFYIIIYLTSGFSVQHFSPEIYKFNSTYKKPYNFYTPTMNSH